VPSPRKHGHQWLIHRHFITDTYARAHADADTGPDTDANAGSNTQSNARPDPDSDSNSDSDRHTDADPHGHSDGESNTNGNGFPNPYFDIGPDVNRNIVEQPDVILVQRVDPDAHADPASNPSAVHCRSGAKRVGRRAT